MSSVSFFFFFFRLHILGCLRTVVWFAMHDLVVVFSTLGNRHLSSPIYTKTTRLHLNLTPQRRHGSGASTWICFQRQQGVGGRQWSGSVSHGASLRLQPAGETAGVPGQCCRQHEADETVISLLTTGELLHCYRRCEVLRQGLSIWRWYLFCINLSVLFHCSLYYPKLDFFPLKNLACFYWRQTAATESHSFDESQTLVEFVLHFARKPFCHQGLYKVCTLVAHQKVLTLSPPH